MATREGSESSDEGDSSGQMVEADRWVDGSDNVEGIIVLFASVLHRRCYSCHHIITYRATQATSHILFRFFRLSLTLNGGYSPPVPPPTPQCSP